MSQKQRDSIRAVRLSLIQHYLHQNKKGLTTRELGELCNATVRTIQRDLLILQSDMHVPVEKQAFDRYIIKKDYILPPVSYSLYEALLLFLAARLIIRQTDESNPHLASAIKKLTSTLPGPPAKQLRQSAEHLARKPLNPDDMDIFEKAAIAWITQKRLRIVYHSYHRGEVEEWLVDPYFIEMTGIAYSTYIIGYGETFNKNGMFTYKLNRIKEAEILDESFGLPPELDLDALLSSSWGVIWGDEVEVKLKFSPGVTRRVKESIWHTSQKIEDLPEGGCTLTLKVGSTLEMTPWIRGWGPDVEVLKPESLRKEMKGWAERLAEIYNRD